MFVITYYYKEKYDGEMCIGLLSAYVAYHAQDLTWSIYTTNCMHKNAKMDTNIHNHHNTSNKKSRLSISRFTSNPSMQKSFPKTSTPC